MDLNSPTLHLPVLLCSHLDMELSEVRSLGERIVLKLRFGCDTAGHKQMNNVD